MKVWNTLVCLWIGVIRGAVLGNDNMVLTSSLSTATDGEPFTLICSISSSSVVAIAWSQNNTLKVITQWSDNCKKQEPPMGDNNINRFNVSCNGTVHSIQFIFNFTRDQGGWQCGNYTNNTYISLRSNIYSLVAGPVTSSSTTTQYAETTSEPEAPQKDDMYSDSDTIYIVVAAVGGAAALLAVVVVAIVCIRRRRQAANQEEDMKKKNVESPPVYQNRTSCYTVDNDLYRRSSDVIIPVNGDENQKDDAIMSDAYANVDMPAASTCTPREQGASNDVDVDSLYAKPDKSRPPNVQQVSDIYAEVKKPRKKRQGDLKASEDVNTGDVCAKPNKG